ncbi:MAG: preprotein translocase subunit SecB [bacterium]|jgi:preprotein translocase subunit SecB
MASKRKNNSNTTTPKVDDANSDADTSTEMAESTKVPEATDAAGAQPVFKIQRVYIKDVSYESPQAPHVFTQNTQWQPSVALHLNTESKALENDIFEVELTVTATVKLGEEVAYLIEIKQAGLFLVKGFEADRLAPMLGSFCPNILFPFAREEIATLVQKGGFPQLLLDPVNFDALYAQHVSVTKQNAPAPDTAQ